MTATDTDDYLENTHITYPETLGNTYSLFIKVRDQWLKARDSLSFQEAVLIGTNAAQRSELPVQIRRTDDEVLAEL